MIKQKDAIILEYQRTKSPALKEQILASYSPLVEYIARKLAFNRNDVDDLVQVGSIGLLRSLDRFDVTMETDFSTFATPNIIGEIKHYFRDKKGILKIPRKLQEMNSKIKRYVKEKQVAGHSPTIAEIAAHLDIDEERVVESMEASQTQMVLSLDSPSYANSSNNSSPQTLLDGLGDDGGDRIILNKITLNAALETLPPREKKIVYLRYYNGLSQTEIAKQINLSQMHISRLLTQSLKRLKAYLKSIDIHSV